MASIVLGVAGSFLGPLGTAAGLAIGGIVDQTLLIPALFGGPPAQEVGKIDSLALQSASEGSPILYLRGPNVRSSGTVIWMPDITENTTTTSAGKDWERVSTTNYFYTANVAIAVCEGEVASIRKIWGDGKLLFKDPASQIEDTSTLFAAVKVSYGSATQAYELRSPLGGPDLTQYQQQVDVSGWSTAANNGRFTVTQVRDNGALGTSLVLGRTGPNIGPTATEPAGPSVTVTSAFIDSDSRSDSITIYKGDLVQTADPLIASIEGSAPAYRGICYVVFNRLRLADFGNRLPQFNFLVERDAAPYTVGTAIADLLERGGLTSAQIDTSAVDPLKLVQGLTVTGPQKIVQTVEALMVAHDLDVRQIAGQLVFRDRTDTVAVVVPSADLAAQSGRGAPDSSTARLISFGDVADVAIPREVDVGYTDPLTEYQQGSQRERRINGDGDAVNSIRLPFVMDSADARNIAHRMLWLAWAQRRTFRMTLPPSHMRFTENDIVRTTVNGETYDLRLTKIDHGFNHVLEVEGYVEGLVNLDASSVTEPPTVTVPELYFPPFLAFHLMDLPPLQDSAVNVAGYYFSVAAADVDAEYLGGSLFAAVAEDATYGVESGLPPEVTQGAATDVLTATSARPQVWDHVNTVTVELNNGTLESRTEFDVLNGANRALVGQEIIAFQTATLVDTRTYELSGLLRGLRDTADHMTDPVHAIGDRFVMLSDSGVVFVEFGTANLNVERWYKAAGLHAEIDDVMAVNETVVGETLTPFSPGHIRGTRNGSNDLTVTWVRRSRKPERLLGGTIVPLVEVSEDYEVDFVNGGGDVVRTVVVGGGATTTTYTAAQQTDDGLTPGDPVKTRVYQIGAVVGRGNRGEETI